MTDKKCIWWNLTFSAIQVVNCRSLYFLYSIPSLSNTTNLYQLGAVLTQLLSQQQKSWEKLHLRLLHLTSPWLSEANPSSVYSHKTQAAALTQPHSPFIMQHVCRHRVVYCMLTKIAFHSGYFSEWVGALVGHHDSFALAYKHTDTADLSWGYTDPICEYVRLSCQNGAAFQHHGQAHHVTRLCLSW